MEWEHARRSVPLNPEVVAALTEITAADDWPDPTITPVWRVPVDSATGSL